MACEAGVQIAVETHSDHFINGIRTTVKSGRIASEKISIYYLSRDTQNSEHAIDVEKVIISSDGKFSHWPPGFFDELDKSLDVLIS